MSGPALAAGLAERQVKTPVASAKTAHIAVLPSHQDRICGWQQKFSSQDVGPPNDPNSTYCAVSIPPATSPGKKRSPQNADHWNWNDYSAGRQLSGECYRCICRELRMWISRSILLLSPAPLPEVLHVRFRFSG